MLAKGSAGVSARRVLAVGLLCVLAACGGGSAGSGADAAPPPQPPPPAGTLTNPPNSGLSQVSLGDSQYVLYAFPGEKTERVLGLALSAPAEFDITVIEGADILSVVQRSGGYSLAVDSTALAAGVGRTYRVAIRNRSTGVAAEILGPVRVIEPTVIGSGLVTSAGGAVTSTDGSLRLEFDAQPNAANLNVTILSFDQPSGGKQLRLKFDRDISAETRGMKIVQAAAASATARRMSGAAESRVTATADRYPGFNDWSRVERVFTLYEGYRLRDGPIALADLRLAYGPNLVLSELIVRTVCLVRYDAWALTGGTAQNSPPDNFDEPVLFVHGYQPSPVWALLGGGASTWGNMLSLVAGPANAPKFTVFEFQWATNARFGDVADDLAQAVSAIYQATGKKKVTIVAHSFGGALV